MNEQENFDSIEPSQETTPEGGPEMGDEIRIPSDEEAEAMEPEDLFALGGRLLAHEDERGNKYVEMSRQKDPDLLTRQLGSQIPPIESGTPTRGGARKTRELSTDPKAMTEHGKRKLGDKPPPWNKD